MSDWKKSVLSGLLGSVVACGVLACGDDTGDGLGGDGDGGKPGTVGGGTDAGRLDGGRDGGRNPGNTGSGGDGGDAEECGALMAIIRDFNPATHPDFEKFSGSGTTGLVKDDLGSDGKPVFNEAKGQLTSGDSFKQWYNTSSINIAVPYSIPLKLAAGSTSSYEFSSNAFFPIDGRGFAAPPAVEAMVNGHNFNFTTEVHTRFTYRGGENFMFQGDDDLWIFVNKKLALDLGGLHSSLSGNINFDDKAAALGIVKGQTYDMDIFHAERHTNESNFTVRTNIDCFMPVVGI
jgi:fibro-slime domain-containing protein